MLLQLTTSSLIIMYYTNENEWIDYLGHTALVGICKIKLSGTKDIQSAAFCDVASSAERGAVIATFYSGTNSFEVRMPVDGKIVGFNPRLLNNPSLVLSKDQKSIWIVKISPNAPYKRDGLLQEHQYKLLQKKVSGAVYG